MVDWVQTCEENHSPYVPQSFFFLLMIFPKVYCRVCLCLIPEIWQGIDFYRYNHHGIPTPSILGHLSTWLDQKHSFNGFPEEHQYFYANFTLQIGFLK